MQECKLLQCTALFAHTSVATCSSCVGSILRCFLPNVPQFGEMCHISTVKALQDGALSGVVSRCGTHTEG